MKAWHFMGDTLRDGRPIPPDGEKLVHDGELVMCRSGLHASKRIIDSLRYAPGNTICRVELSGEIKKDTDKMVASERTILWRVNGEKILKEFARKCALDVIHLWDAPDVVREYLETGDESKRDAARDAAGAAAWAAWAARAAAEAAAMDAARVAAEAARAAAWAARDAAGGAARAAAEAAAMDAARVAAMDAAGAAAWAAGAAAWDARDAARAAQNKQLEAIVRNAR